MYTKNYKMADKGSHTFVLYYNYTNQVDYWWNV